MTKCSKCGLPARYYTIVLPESLYPDPFTLTCCLLCLRKIANSEDAPIKTKEFIEIIIKKITAKHGV